MDGVVLSRRTSVFLLLVGVWTWLIWPRFAKAIWDDPRSWRGGAVGHGGATSFLEVHTVLVAVSLALGTVVGVIGWRGWRWCR